MALERRTVLKSGAAAAALAIAGGPFRGLLVSPGSAAVPRAPFRELRPIPDLRDGQVRLHLPAGFEYRSFHDTEFAVDLDDGTRLPGRHDGMGAFSGPDGNVILVRNHEITNSPNTPAFGPGTPYDAQAGAGTTTVEVTPFGEVMHAHTSLNGTMFN
ncbi:MAG: alkaline phosphatase PhoX, partial [Nocardioidaceae bacterium]